MPFGKLEGTRGRNAPGSTGNEPHATARQGPLRSVSNWRRTRRLRLRERLCNSYTGSSRLPPAIHKANLNRPGAVQHFCHDVLGDNIQRCVGIAINDPHMQSGKLSGNALQEPCHCSALDTFNAAGDAEITAHIGDRCER